MKGKVIMRFIGSRQVPVDYDPEPLLWIRPPAILFSESDNAILDAADKALRESILKLDFGLRLKDKT